VLVVLAIVGLFLLPSPWGVVALGTAVAVEVVELVFWRWFLRRYRVRVGPETLLGMRAEVVQPCSPVGLVRVRGELWNARASAPVDAGQTVIVSGVEGLTLRVEPDR
jgi:membrane protein implicated in regulation of membrane protease activity